MAAPKEKKRAPHADKNPEDEIEYLDPIILQTKARTVFADTACAPRSPCLLRRRALRPNPCPPPSYPVLSPKQEYVACGCSRWRLVDRDIAALYSGRKKFQCRFADFSCSDRCHWCRYNGYLECDCIEAKKARMEAREAKKSKFSDYDDLDDEDDGEDSGATCRAAPAVPSWRLSILTILGCTSAG